MFPTRTHFDEKLNVWSGSDGVSPFNCTFGFGHLLLDELYKSPADYVIQVILSKTFSKICDKGPSHSRIRIL